ncbi:DoxX family protein [Umezawaea sp. NPDC059074]|uniref:DoxX family protein n=1 Tax=Umezawaea sp. NPDC059074 TaxID=3346716 RepID=UPI0036CC1D16
MFIATLVLSALLALVFLGAGFAKITKNPKMVEAATSHGFTVGQYQLIGAAEVAGAAGLAIGLWWAPLGIAAAVGLTLLMIGAVITHVRFKEAFALVAPSLVLAVLSAAALVLRITTA